MKKERKIIKVYTAKFGHGMQSEDIVVTGCAEAVVTDHKITILPATLTSHTAFSLRSYPKEDLGVWIFTTLEEALEKLECKCGTTIRNATRSIEEWQEKMRVLESFRQGLAARTSQEALSVYPKE
mgnify:CR=1 FL=1